MRKRALSAVLALSICLPVFHAAAISSEEDPAASVQTFPNDALHFIVRHWHSNEDTDAKLQAKIASVNSDRYFVVAEGYIVPHNSTYKFYLVYQGDTNDGHSAGEWKEIDTEFISASDYIEDIDPENGAITLKAKPLMKDGDTPLEYFSAFSVSAGHSAVSSIGSSLTITYDPYVHLVKAHAFYVRGTMEVDGTQDETVFGSAGTEADEQDTAWVYTYIKDQTDNDNITHKKGEIVRDANGDPVKETDDLPEGLTDGENVELTKVYDTAEGLHTDKTAYVNSDADDGRTFDLELEAWFAQGYAPQIGMILDASGSMAFSSDIPNRIQLTEKQIEELKINTLPNAAGKSGEPNGGWEHYFLTPEQLDRILDPRRTDNSPLSVSGYGYFVLNASEYAPLGYWEGVDPSYRFDEDNTVGPSIAKTWDGRILGSINLTSSNATIAPSLHHKQAGWYFVTHSGQYDNHYKLIGSGKRLIGLNGTQTSNGVEGVNVRDTATGYTYTNRKTDTPIRFYVDAGGNLLCFFSSSGNDSSKCSYVYELKDNQYVRTESLQRALGVFVTELNEFSPAARVSAVRFSTDNIRELTKLVLLDWTNDPSESTGILSLERGSGSEKGTAIGSTLSSANKLEQYNYGLTGSTSTWRGLQAYIDNLQEHDDPFDGASEDVPKYLIIFTDGADTDHNNSSKTEEERGKALALADKLKNDNGYTIFTVLLDGGSMSAESYADAEKFLLSLAGKSTYDDSDDNVSKYFFSVHKAKEELGDSADGMNDADILMQIFVDKILEEIVDPLENYTVKDYIDPRFDLVDGDGVVWHLNANGSVVKGDGAMAEDRITIGSTLDTQITLSDKSDKNADHPYLCYDADAQMYYLQWADQVIPGSAVGANRLAVWNAMVTVRAKEDFIGGNAVLTNGNAAAQNLVFYSNDAAPSSGIDRANDENNPSKGFPRVTVNVRPLIVDRKKELTVFMGEKLNMETVLADLIGRAETEGWYYWEYLTRYARSTDAYAAPDTEGEVQRVAKELAKAFIKGYDSDETLENAIIKIPYFYLDKTGGAAAPSGSDMHRADGLGTMIYSVELPTDKLLFSETGWTVKTNNAINAVLRAAYLPLGSARTGVLPAAGLKDSRKDANDTLVTEKDKDGNGIYLWNEDYKPAAGVMAESSDAVVGDKIEVVSGEIALQVLISDAAAAKLQSLENTITYTADLYWNDVKVGTFTAEINADALVDNTVKATVKYDDIGDFDREAYGLPLGIYTVKNGHSATELPMGFNFGNIMLSKTESDYVADLFSRGTGNSTPKDYIATVSGTSFILGDKSDKLYTDHRFGLAQVELKYTELWNHTDPPIPEAAPNTGDKSRIDLWVVFMILSLTGIVVILFSKRKI